MTTAAYSKKVRISDDGGSTYSELPVESGSPNMSPVLQGNTDLSNNQGFKSRIYGLRDFNIPLEGNFVPGLTYQFNVKNGGTPVGFTDETMSNTTGNTWKIDDVSKEIWDRTVPVTFEDNAVAIPDVDIESIDYLNGTVTFTGVKSGPVTVTGSSIPTTTTLCTTTATLDMSVELEEDTNMKSNTNGWKTRHPKLKDVSLSLSGINDLSKSIFDSLTAGDVLLMEILIGTSDIQAIRGWFVIESDNLSGGVSDIETEDISLQLDGDGISSFAWAYPATGFSPAIKKLTDSFFAGSDLFIQTVPEDILANGLEGPVILESFSLNMDINGKLTFSSTLQGDGQLIDAT